MNLLGPDIKHEVLILINDKNEHRLLAPKLATRDEVILVAETLINAAVALANQYGVQVSLKERTP